MTPMRGRVFLRLAGSGGNAYRCLMRSFRQISVIALCALILLTSQSMAVARGQMPPDGQMVLCTGAGSVVIFVDENGQPTTAPHLCPDCILTLANVSSPPLPVILSQVESQRLRWPGAIPAAPVPAHNLPLPRGPPLM